MSMIRLIIQSPFKTDQVLEFSESTVTIGRSQSNHIQLDDLGVSKVHGSVSITKRGYVYRDLNSTNGSLVLRGEQKTALNSPGHTESPIVPGDEIQIAAYTLRLDERAPLLSTEKSNRDQTVILSRPVLDRKNVQDEVLFEDPRLNQLFKRLVRETGSAGVDESGVVTAIDAFVLEAFPKATHVSLVVTDLGTGELRQLLSRSRGGGDVELPFSRTFANQVMEKGEAVLYTKGQRNLSGVDSLENAKIETAICAPLRGPGPSFGVIQLDIRGSNQTLFTHEDLELLGIVSSHLGTILDDLRLDQEQRASVGE